VKLFVCADMEGATGVVHRDQLLPEGGAPYPAACKLLTEDIVAAIEGACAAGVTEVVISEGHAHMRNVILEELPACARLVRGPAAWAQKPLCQIAGLDASFDVAFFLGFHSRAGTPGGLLSHTWAGAIVHELRLDGRVVGETAINAAICGDFGVPVGLVAGADDLVREARQDLGDDLEAVTTKLALGFNLAECWSPKHTQPQLREAARRAVERHRSGPRPVYRTARPCVAELDIHRREMADKMSLVPGLARVGERTVRVEAADATSALSTLWHGITEAFKDPAGWLA
jgi:D-amino peptidase